MRISRSVAQTPSARVRTRIAPSESGGSGTSSSGRNRRFRAKTVIARIPVLSVDGLDFITGGAGCGIPRANRAPSPILAERLRCTSTKGSGRHATKIGLLALPILLEKKERGYGSDRTQAVAIPEGYIPSESSFSDRALVSHETACILNAGDDDAHVTHDLFADREPVGPTA